ncbi:DUF368 domain-containing protein [Mycoplasmatota bacterium WC30]
MIFFELLTKGFFMGIAFIIPGVSGGTLAVYLGIYEKFLHAIGNIFKEFKKSIKFLIPVFLGIGISVVLLAKLFSILIEWNSFVVLGFFIGLILGGVKQIYTTASKKKLSAGSVISFLIAFAVIIVLIVFEKTKAVVGIDYFDINFSNIVIIFLLGMAASITMIVPGVSGSALLLVLGFYTAIVSNVIGEIFDFSNIVYNLQVVIPFGIGALAGIILFSRVIEFCLKNYKSQTYYAILGFILASCVAIFFEIRDPGTSSNYANQIPIYKDFWNYLSNNILSIAGGVLTLVAGFVSTRLLTKIDFKKGKTNE